MSDTDEDGDAEPAVELGDGPAVDGEPVARVAARLTWPATRSEINAQEGDAVVRTPDGPTQLTDVLDESDVPLYESRSEFRAAVTDVVGDGPVATE